MKFDSVKEDDCTAYAVTKPGLGLLFLSEIILASWKATISDTRSDGACAVLPETRGLASCIFLPLAVGHLL